MYEYPMAVAGDGWGERGRNLAAVDHALRQCIGSSLCKQRVPLELQVLDQEDLGEGLLMEKIHYQTEPGEFVPAYLLRPHRPIGPLAGIVAFHGHGGRYEVGKDGVIGRHERFASLGMGYGLQLARAGYVVLCPDSVCFGERRNPAGDRIPDIIYERIVTMREISAGGSMVGKNIWDNMRAIDVLQSLGYIDPERIGGIGLSMGSGMTFFTMMCDPRMKAGVAVCSMYTIRALFELKLLHCYMNYIPRMIEAGLEMYDIFPLIAPRALMLVNPTDSYEDPLEATRELYQKSQWAWQEKDAEEAFALEIFEGKHEFPADQRSKALDWFRKFL